MYFSSEDGIIILDDSRYQFLMETIAASLASASDPKEQGCASVRAVALLWRAGVFPECVLAVLSPENLEEAFYRGELGS